MATENSNITALKSEFSPYSQLQQTVLGRDLLNLYLTAESAPDNAYLKLEKIKNENSIKDNPIYQFAYYRILHKLEIARSKPKAAENAIITLFEYSKLNKLDWLQAEANMWLASFQIKRGEFSKASILLKSALPIAHKKKFYRLEARIHNSNAIINSQQGKLLLARKDYYQALSILKRYENDPYLSKITSNISIIFAQLEQWNKALEYNKKAISYYYKSNAKSFQQIAKLHINASFIHRKNNIPNTLELQRAHLQKAQNYAKKSGNIYIQTNVLSNLSDHWFESGQYHLALDYAEQCLINAKEINFKFSLAYCHLFKGQIKVHQQHYNQGQKLLLTSLMYFESLKMNDGLRLVYLQLEKLYLKQKDYENAYLYSGLYYKNKLDSLFNKRQLKLNALEEKHTAEANQQEIALLSAKNALQQSTLAQQSLRETIAVLFFLIALIPFYFLIRHYTILKKQNGSLESFNNTLYQQSHHDALTGLFNRRYFDGQIKSYQSLKNKDRHILAMIDIDYFKRINDNFGHDIGDEVLCVIANIIKDKIRKTDFVARWGGEEFVILFNQNDLSHIKAILNRIKNSIENKTINTNKGDISVTVSIGVSATIAANASKQHWAQALKFADTALYQAKNSGRNRIVFHNQM